MPCFRTHLLGAGLLGVLLLALGTDGDGQQLLELLAQESLCEWREKVFGVSEMWMEEEGKGNANG